jgi:hypothetical protein
VMAALRPCSFLAGRANAAEQACPGALGGSPRSALLRFSR